MRIDLEFLEVATPLFLNGINFGVKLYPNTKGGLNMWYDTDHKMVFLVHSGKVAAVQHITSMTLAKPEQWGIDATQRQDELNQRLQVAQAKAVSAGPIQAQVSTPMSQPPKKVGGKIAKFQGEESQGE